MVRVRVRVGCNDCRVPVFIRLRLRCFGRHVVKAHLAWFCRCKPEERFFMLELTFQRARFDNVPLGRYIMRIRANMSLGMFMKVVVSFIKVRY